MNQTLLRHIILTLTFISVINFNYAQGFLQSGINAGAKFGASKLLGEIPNDYSGIINEFDNKAGFASAFEISKYISPCWEIGSEISFSVLKGNAFSPQLSAEGVQAGIPASITEPVEYKNKLFGQNLFFKYFFKPAFSESVFNPFIRAGGGYINYYSQFKYIDAPNNDLLFGKGSEGYTKLSTPVLVIGTGFKTSISSNFSLATSIDFNVVSYDFLDVVHNYNKEKKRLEIIGLYTEFKIGIFYNIPFSGNEKNKQSKSKRGKSSSNSYLPFAR